MSSAFVTPGSPLKSSCASYPAQADVFFYAQGKNSKQASCTELTLPIQKFDLDAMLHFKI